MQNQTTNPRRDEIKVLLCAVVVGFVVTLYVE